MMKAEATLRLPTPFFFVALLLFSFPPFRSRVRRGNRSPVASSSSQHSPHKPKTQALRSSLPAQDPSPHALTLAPLAQRPLLFAFFSRSPRSKQLSAHNVRARSRFARLPRAQTAADGEWRGTWGRRGERGRGVTGPRRPACAGASRSLSLVSSKPPHLSRGAHPRSRRRTSLTPTSHPPLPHPTVRPLHP